MAILFSNFEENNLLYRYQGRCKGSVSEKGKMKSPFRLNWFYWSLFYFMTMSAFAIILLETRRAKQKKIYDDDVSKDNKLLIIKITVTFFDDRMMELKNLMVIIRGL